MRPDTQASVAGHSAEKSCAGMVRRLADSTAAASQPHATTWPVRGRCASRATTAATSTALPRRRRLARSTAAEASAAARASARSAASAAEAEEGEGERAEAAAAPPFTLLAPPLVLAASPGGVAGSELEAV
jgi:hypothetical protein